MGANYMDKQELYKIAVDTRKFEIQMFWQRSNYFLVLNTAIAIGFFANKDDLVFVAIIASLGVIVSVLWSGVTFGGKYWQSSWEEAARRLEEDVAPEAKLFSTEKEDTHWDVERSLSSGSHSLFRRFVNWCVLKKPSVSYMMVILSLAFFVFWLSLSVIVFWNIIF